MDDLPQRFVIRESSHRIHNPFTSEKLATLGRALHLSPGTSMLDLACGSGEMLCTWARYTQPHQQLGAWLSRAVQAGPTFLTGLPWMVLHRGELQPSDP